MLMSNHLWGESLNSLVAPDGWLTLPGDPEPPFVAAYRLEVELPAAAVHTALVHAEERYELFLNGERLGRGSERGDLTHQFCEEYQLRFRRGRNHLSVRTWSLGKIAPYAQMTDVNGGLAVFSENADTQALLATGVAPWTARRLPGYEFFVKHPTTGNMTGPSFKIDGREFDWDWDAASGQAAARNPLPAKMRFHRAALPPMEEGVRPNGVVRHLDALPGETVSAANHLVGEADAWNGFLNGAPLTIPAHTVRRVIVDLDDYSCVYPSLQVSGGRGAQIQWSWAEALFKGADKGNRDEIEGKQFVGHGDIFIAGDGARQEFAPLWWRACRYFELLVTTADTPVTLEKMTLAATGYPLREDAGFQCADPELNRLRPLLTHSLRMCCHETYMDCPYYEQLMYVGDTRLEMLVTYAMTRDHRLPRKALKLFHDSFLRSGLTQSRYPNSALQIIPPFSLWWIAMLHDYAMRHDDPELVRVMLPAVRQTLATFAATARPRSALVTGPVGWNFYDWVEGWKAGVPPTQKDWTWGHLPDVENCGMPPTPDAVPAGIMNQHYAMILKMASELEGYVGAPDNAARLLGQARSVADELRRDFWRDDQQLFADDLEGKHYSEHSQVLALLSGLLPEEQVPPLLDALLHRPGLSRATVYFSHYLLEAIWQYSNYEELRPRLELWTGFEAQGFRATPETPEPSRSDCHAWGSHPYHHFFASLAGIRPTAFGGGDYLIRPIDGGPDCSGSLPLRQGDLKFDLSRERAEIDVPPNLNVTLQWQGRQLKLQPGKNRIHHEGL